MDLYIQTTDNSLDLYTQVLSGISSVDLYFVNDIIVPAMSTKLIDLEISCELKLLNNNFSTKNKLVKFYNNKSFFIIPKNNIAMTPLRLSNTPILIEAGRDENIKVYLDNTSKKSYKITRGDSLLQIVSPDLSNFNNIILK